MELDELKTILNDVGSAQKNTAELEKYLHAQSTSVLARIKRNLWFEFVFAIAFIAFATVLMSVFTHDYTRWFGFLLLAVCAWFTIYAIWLFRRIGHIEKSALPLQSTLQQVIKILERFINLYFQLTMLMIPGSFVLAFLTAYVKAKKVYDPISFFTAGRIALYAGIIIVFSVVMYFITRWYLQKLYGKHLLKLRNQLKDLQNG